MRDMMKSIYVRIASIAGLMLMITVLEASRS